MDICRFSEQHVEESSMSTTTKTTSSYMETRTEMSNQETSYVSMMNGSGPSVTSEKRSSQQQVSHHRTIWSRVSVEMLFNWFIYPV